MKKILTYIIITITFYVFVALTYSQTYPEGMISYWKFDNGDGTTAIDSVGTNNGTIEGGATWATGIVNGGRYTGGLAGKSSGTITNAYAIRLFI